MAIQEIIKDDTGEKIYKYIQPDYMVLYNEVELVMQALNYYVQKQGDLKMDDLNIDFAIIAEALVRLDKRKDYFVIFHDDTDMNEVKRSALLAYWILKFKPIHIKTDNKVTKGKYRKINEAFAVFVIYSTVCEEIKRKTGNDFYVSKDYNRKIMYGFKFWDISKEALMLIVESLCESKKR